MTNNFERQGHNPNDAEEFAGLGCLGFIIVCGGLIIWWCIKTLWGILA